MSAWPSVQRYAVPHIDGTAIIERHGRFCYCVELRYTPVPTRRGPVTPIRPMERERSAMKLTAGGAQRWLDRQMREVAAERSLEQQRAAWDELGATP